MLYKGKKKYSWVLKEELNSLKELYSDDGILFYQYCEHSVDFVQVDTSLKLSKTYYQLFIVISLLCKTEIFLKQKRGNFETDFKGSTSGS